MSDLHSLPEMSAVEDVLIVGAGLAGAALGLALQRRGIRACLVDPGLPDNNDFGAGLLITGNATRALAALGLASKLASIARPVSGIDFADQQDVKTFSIECCRPDWPTFYVARHARIRRMLLQDTAKLVHPGLAISAVLDAEEPTVALSDGTVRRFGIVVGADGVHSDLRSRLFPGSTAEPISDYRGYRFITHCPGVLDRSRYLVGNGRTLLLHPLLDGEVYCGAGPISGECFVDAPTALQAIRRLYADFGGVVRDVLASLSESTHFIPTRYWQVDIPRWQLGGCMLIGDAAHASAPTLSQGAAMAFEDAIVLAEELEGAPIARDALRAFETRRRPRTTWVQGASRASMAANRMMGSRERELLNETTRRFGQRSLESQWGHLIAERP